MKVQYVSDVLNRVFNSAEECTAAEAEHEQKVAIAKKKAEEERARKRALSDEREERKKEVDEAFENARKLREAYLKDYQTYSYESNSLYNLFDLLNW